MERIGLLKHHANGFTQLIEVLARRVDVVSTVLDFALDTAASNLAIHKVKAAQKRRFTATGRSDESRNLVLVKGQRGVVQSMMVAVVDIHVLGLEHHLIGDSKARHAVLFFA